MAFPPQDYFIWCGWSFLFDDYFDESFILAKPEAGRLLEVWHSNVRPCLQLSALIRGLRSIAGRQGFMDPIFLICYCMLAGSWLVCKNSNSKCRILETIAFIDCPILAPELHLQVRRQCSCPKLVIFPTQNPAIGLFSLSEQGAN